jgi:hypothetical protein
MIIDTTTLWLTHCNYGLVHKLILVLPKDSSDYRKPGKIYYLNFQNFTGEPRYLVLFAVKACACNGHFVYIASNSMLTSAKSIKFESLCPSWKPLLCDFKYMLIKQVQNFSRHKNSGRLKYFQWKKGEGWGIPIWWGQQFLMVCWASLLSKAVFLHSVCNNTNNGGSPGKCVAPTKPLHRKYT